MRRHDSTSSYGSQRSYDSDMDGPRQGPSSRDLLNESKRVRQETLNVAKDSLSRLRSTEETATRTMDKLNAQSEALYKSQSGLNNASVHERVAGEQVKEIKRLNKLFGFSFFKSKKKQERLENLKIEEESQDRMRDLEQMQAARSETRNRMDKQRMESQRRQGGGRSGTSSSMMKSDLLDDEDRMHERELDDTLEDIGGVLGNLKQMALTMNSEVQHQNQVIGKLTRHTEDLNVRINQTNHKVKNIK